MSKRIRLKYWPFKENEKATLIRISKPYQKDQRWFIDGLFYSESGQLEKIKYNIGDLLILHLDGIYINSVFSGYKSGSETDITFSQTVIKNRVIKPYLIKDKKDAAFDYYTFGIPSGNKFIIIPLMELVRAVLAPDTFWMNQITQMDTLDTTLIKTFKNDILYLDFDSGIPVSYISYDVKINHLAWIMTNPEIINMMNELYKNIVDEKGFLFNFQFTSMDMRVFAEQVDDKVFVKEIKILRGKRIKAQGVEVCHPQLYKNTSDETRDQSTKTIKVGGGDTRLLDTDKAADMTGQDIIDNHFSKSEYIGYVKINRIRNDRKQPQSIETEKTTRLYKKDDSVRTTGDFGGNETVPQLEFNNDLAYTYDNEFDEMIGILDLLKEREEIKNVQKYIGNLETHCNNGSFSKLSNGESPRRFLIGKIVLKNGKEAVLIEIERETRSLTTLMLVSSISVNWNEICHKVLQGIVKNSGSWPREILLKIKNDYFVKELRFNHTEADIEGKKERIFKSI
jgi:hypothetical protein